MGLISWYRRVFCAALPSARLLAVQQAAESGDANAQFALGIHFSSGSRIPHFAQAAHWYRKAADQDHALAQFNLGQMFAHGQGQPQDEAAAVRWIRKSAEGGDAGAQFNLGSRYHRHSVGVDAMDNAESRIEAYKWYTLAAAQGYKDSQVSCERLALAMSREEVTDGQERIQTFVARSSLPASSLHPLPDDE